MHCVGHYEMSVSSTARPRYTAEYVTELFYFRYVALSAKRPVHESSCPRIGLSAKRLVHRRVRELSCPRTGCPRIGLSAKSPVTFERSPSQFTAFYFYSIVQGSGTGPVLYTVYSSNHKAAGKDTILV